MLRTSEVVMMPVLEATDFDFDIDRYLNRFIPRNGVHVLPRCLSHFLGYRVRPYREPGNILIAWWSFAGAFVGIAVVEWMFKVPLIASHGVPTIVASSVRTYAAWMHQKKDTDFSRAPQPF